MSQWGVRSGQNCSTHPQMSRSTVGQWFLVLWKTQVSLSKGRKKQQYLLLVSLVLELEAGCQSDRNLIGGASNTCHLLHPATLGLMGGTLHQCRAGIGHSGPGRHADWVRGRGRSGAGGGGGEGLAAVGPRFHLDQLIPDFTKTQRQKRNYECNSSAQEVQSSFEEEMQDLNETNYQYFTTSFSNSWLTPAIHETDWQELIDWTVLATVILHHQHIIRTNVWKSNSGVWQQVMLHLNASCVY